MRPSYSRRAAATETGQATQAGPPQGTTPAGAGGATAPAGVDPQGPTGLLGTPPDPAAVSRPGWPRLVAADGGYTPPRLLGWPIVLGILLLAGWTAATVSLRASPGSLRQPGSSSPARPGRCPVRRDRRRRPLHGHLPRHTAAVNPERGTHHCQQLNGAGCQACSRRHLLPAARIGLVQPQRQHHWDRLDPRRRQGDFRRALPQPARRRRDHFLFRQHLLASRVRPRSGWSGSDHLPTPWKDSGPRPPASRTTSRFCSALSRRAHKAANDC